MATDILNNFYNTKGKLIGAKVGASLLIPATGGLNLMLQDVATGTWYGVYFKNGDLSSVPLDADFNPTEDL